MRYCLLVTEGTSSATNGNNPSRLPHRIAPQNNKNKQHQGPKTEVLLFFLYIHKEIMALYFSSHVQAAGERVGYITELLTKYYRGDLTSCTHCENLFTTSAVHPLPGYELLTINEVLSSLMPHHPVIRQWMQANEGLGVNIMAYFVLSR